jgi:hypothetical protein
MRNRDNPDGAAPLRLERRLAPRRNTHIEAEVAFDGGQRLPCIVKNVSETGAMLEMQGIGKVPNTFSLLVAGHRPQLCRVVWRTLKQMGVEYQK